MRKVVTVILVMLLCLNGVNTMTLTIHANEVVANQQVEHPLEPGDSPEGNPLKGFIPYDELTTGTTTEFPHSLEWFYVPVKAIQSDMNTFDWEGDAGEYSLALKVMNPLANGPVLKFANKEQGEDGWLSLGEFTVANTNNIQEENDNGAPSENEGDASKDTDASKAEVDRQPIAVWIGLVILLIAIVTGSLVYNRKRSK